MTSVRGDALEVWGDPIEHSRSPVLHAAAYGRLGVPWTYGRRQVSADGFSRTLASLDPSFRGLSLTYPLKGAAFAAAATRDRHAVLTGAVNTLVVGVTDGPLGFNTDVGGLSRDLREQGVSRPESARIVGAGATAASALVALGDLGVPEVEIVARTDGASAALHDLGSRIGVRVRTASFLEASYPAVPLTISTLPGGATLAESACEALAAGGGLLYDVVYGHWPTALAQAWQRAGSPAVAGIGMLVHQALLQVRAFMFADPTRELEDERDVVAAMRATVT